MLWCVAGMHRPYQTDSRFGNLGAMPQARAIATQSRLTAAARELFGTRGYEATSIEAVLERAGVKRGALYHHFAGKHALFDAVLEQVVADVALAGMDAA